MGFDPRRKKNVNNSPNTNPNPDVLILTLTLTLTDGCSHRRQVGLAMVHAAAAGLILVQHLRGGQGHVLARPIQPEPGGRAL